MSALLKPDLPAVDLTSARAAGAALRTFFRLADAWQLSVAEQTTLLGVARTTLYQWKQGKAKEGAQRSAGGARRRQVDGRNIGLEKSTHRSGRPPLGSGCAP